MEYFLVFDFCVVLGRNPIDIHFYAHIYHESLS